MIKKIDLLKLPTGTAVHLIYNYKKTGACLARFITMISSNSTNPFFLFWEDPETPGDDAEQMIDQINDDGSFEPMYGDGDTIAHFELFTEQ